MAGIPLSLYHHLPLPLRSLAAGLRGYYLAWWRYGRATDQLVETARERERWPAEQWKKYQEERLATILKTAANRVPYYRQYWAAHGGADKSEARRHLANWPILQKSELRRNPKAFLRDAISPASLFELHTSGTTGTPLTLWRTRQTNINYYALFERRIRHWNQVTRFDRWAILGGQLIAPFEQTAPPFWVWNAGLRQLYMSSYHLTRQNAPFYLEALNKYGIKYLLGYASSLYSLSLVLREQNLRLSGMKVVISNAEPLLDHQRRLIQKTFDCPVRDTYGMAEIVIAGSECEHGNMHLCPELGFVEILDLKEDRPVPAGATGRIVCTGLFSEEMPLIRYETGDLGSIAPEEASCGCGRTLPILKSIEGRMDDILITMDGRRIGRLDPVFKADLPIIEAQIIQERWNTLRIRLVPGKDYSPSTDKQLIDMLRRRVGDMRIVIDVCDSIPRSANGKFRSVISKLTTSQHL